MQWHWVVQVAVAVALAYALFLAAILLYARRHPDVLSMGEAARLGPDLLRLVRRLAVDRSVPRRSRTMLWLLVAYLVLPIDLVPDVLPVIGYVDDVVLTAVVLRPVVRSAGADALARHWPGSDGGLRIVRALAGIERPDAGGRHRNTA